MRALATDLYQLTMAAGYFARGMSDRVATCEMFVRRMPPRRRYLVTLGIEAIATYLEELSFEDEDIAFMKTVPALADAMTPAFVDYLKAFRFTGDLEAMPEGTIAFANEPFFRVRAPLIEAQIVETYVLSIVNHQTMVASKAARIVGAAGEAAVVEFGTRRTHPDAAVDAARAAYAAGFAGTSNVEASRRFGIPLFGTAAHMWTMAHPSEEASFEAYASVFPNATILLIDTYDTDRGAERAARAAKERLRGVRIDSGDLDASSRSVRKILDENGCLRAKIVASGDLNEHTIAALRAAKAPIDTYGVGTELVTSLDAPALGGVYKIVELEDGAGRRPIAKFSTGKATFPGAHQVHRVSKAGLLARDVLALADEPPPHAGEGEAGAPLLESFMRKGLRVRPADTLATIRERVKAGLASLPPDLRAIDPNMTAAEVHVQASSALEALSARLKHELVGSSEKVV